MELEVTNALFLSKQSNNNEGKVAAFVLGLQVYEKKSHIGIINNDNNTVKEYVIIKEVFLCQLVQNCSIEFLRDMILCPVEKIQNIGVTVLSKLVSIPHMLQKFSIFDQMIHKIVRLYLSSSTITEDSDTTNSYLVSKSTLLQLLQSLIGSASRDIVRSVINKLLSSSEEHQISQQNNRIIIETLELLSYCCVCLESNVGTGQSERLSASQAAVLRSLFVQGLHGALPSKNRELAFLVLAGLLQPQSQISALDPCWTVETSMTNLAPGSDAATNTTATATATVGQFARLLSSLVAGELHLWVEECLEGKTLPHQDKDNLESVSQSKQRYELLCTMVNTLLELIDSMQFLLLGPRQDTDDDDDDDDDDDEMEGGVWASLPSTVLIQIQTNLHDSVTECFDLVKWCVKQPDRTHSGPLVQKSAQTLCAWIAEDDQLHPLFPAQLDVLLCLCVGYTCLPTNIHTSRSIEDLQALHQLASKKFISDPGDSGEVHDVALFLFPCVLAIFSIALESDEVLAERLLGATHLFSVAVHTVCALLSSSCSFSSSSSSSSPDMSTKFDTLFEASCDLIECILELKRADILVLLPVEGTSSIGYVLGYSIEPLLIICLYELLTNVKKVGSSKWSPVVLRVSDQLLCTLKAFM